jgi:hypothetical protein
VSSVSATPTPTPTPTPDSGRRGGLVALGVVLIVVAILAAIAGVIYLTTKESSIPSFLPGHVTTGKDANLHHTFRGIGGIVVAVILLIGAGFTFRRPKVNSSSES